MLIRQRWENSLASQGIFDVAIVGYGPVGQVLAALLGRRGFNVVVLEKHLSLYGKPRAGHCDGETMRTFQCLGIAETLERLMRPITCYELVGADWTILHRIAIGQSGSGWKASYLFHQPELEDVLDAAARSYRNVQVLAGHEVCGLSQDSETVTLTVRSRQTTGNGATPDSERLQARFVVGSDGGGSYVRSALGIGRNDLGFAPFEFLVIDFEHNDPDKSLPAMGEVRQILDPARPTTAGRWNGNRWSRWEFMRMPGESRAFMEDEATVWRLLEPWGIDQRDGKLLRRALYKFESQIAEHWRDGRVLLCGDAAHTMPPFMAQGLCSGIRDALNLNWKLDMVLRDRASPALLDSYECERKPHVEAITRMAMRIGELVTMTDPQQAKLRDEALAAGATVLPHGFPTLRVGLLAQTEGGVLGRLAGELAPQARVYRDGRVARLDDHVGYGWRIIARHPVADQLNGRFGALVRDLEITAAHVTRGCVGDAYLDIDADYASWFHQNGVEAFVQRPDMYIFGAAQKVSDLPAVLASLEAQMRDYGLQPVGNA
jgi:3-(3-hydroxy-phenyl)propionate hydroxylase